MDQPRMMRSPLGAARVKPRSLRLASPACLALFLGLLMHSGGCAPTQSGPGTRERQATHTSQTLERHEFTRLCMGVQTRIVIHADSYEIARDAAARAFDRIATLEQVMSDYRPDSEVSLLTARSPSPSTPHSPPTPPTPIPVSEDLYDVLALSSRLAVASDGAFDVTIGPLVKLWREARRSATLPSAEAIAAARRRVGFQAITLTPGATPSNQAGSPPTVTLGIEGMQIDFGGVGKGYAAQHALDQLKREGFPRSLVALSGDVAVGEPPLDPKTGRALKGWRIDIETGFDQVPSDASEPDPRAPTILLRNAAVSTSGDLEQFIEIDGVRYAHILDPRTGLGLTTRVAAVVVASRSEHADPLATILCIIGPDQQNWPDSRVRSMLRSFDVQSASLEWLDAQGERRERVWRF